ncbi:MAG: hypothetical protein C0598_14460 [Marinilabiliales bacterium]|nr:MAG: hypothetical protein C0598_14460 [Marinilabiliales bacterium]
MLLLSYLVRSTIIISILYTVYYVFFSKQKSLVFNRILLISIVLTGILTPVLIKLNLSLSENFGSLLVNKINLNYWLEEVTINANLSEHTNAVISWEKLIIPVYLIISLALLINLIIKIVKIIKLINNNQKYHNQGFNYVILKNSSSAFSFFNYLFIGDKIYNKPEVSTSIIEHEKNHIRQKHSLDILLAEILIIINWFNPISYLIKKSLSETHEYLADEGTLNELNNIDNYKLLLLRNSSLPIINSITHNFSYPLLKKRIDMMTRKNSKIKMILGAIVLPIAFGISILACSSPKSDAMDDKVKQEKEVMVNNPGEDYPPPPEKSNTENTDSDEVVFTVVETMPEFPGGRSELYKYLGENIKYPESAKKDGVQGKVFVSYVVNTDGSITDAKILRGVSEELDAEALRVIKSMPNWKPGEQKGKKVRVAFNLPINFKLD